MSVAEESGPVRVDGSLPAYKAAVLVTDEHGGALFRGVGFGGRYGPADVAQCFHVAEHVPPHPGCSCGFYGWRDRRAALELISERVVAVLEVELWGAFHEFERGYVAAAQTVRTVTLRPWCARCPWLEPDQADPVVGLTEDTTGDGELVPVCAEHARDADLVWTPEALSASLGAPVAWAVDGDDLARRDLGRLLETPPVFERHLPGLDDLLPGEIGHVFQEAIAQDDEGSLWIDPTARLVQPLPGRDVPIKLGDDGRHEIELHGVRVAKWRKLDDPARFALPLRPLGEPLPPRTDTEP